MVVAGIASTSGSHGWPQWQCHCHWQWHSAAGSVSDVACFNLKFRRTASGSFQAASANGTLADSSTSLLVSTSKSCCHLSAHASAAATECQCCGSAVSPVRVAASPPPAGVVVDRHGPNRVTVAVASPTSEPDSELLPVARVAARCRLHNRYGSATHTARVRQTLLSSPPASESFKLLPPSHGVAGLIVGPVSAVTTR